jgi:uncharacterized protein YjcR
MMDINDIVTRINKIEERLNVIETTLISSEFGILKKPLKKQQSIKEFLLTKKISSTVQRTLVICYFLEYVVGMNTFSIKDVEKAFRSAKEKLPTNLSDMINKNVSKGYLMEDNLKKDGVRALVLTSSGETFVENNLNN